jgi:hypothetical protein
MTIRASIEHFHLLFCRHLLSGPDRADFAIKGGCNLRFFFGSIVSVRPTAVARRLTRGRAAVRPGSDVPASRQRA